jgi:nucleoside-diphosphate-sugar epimerase
VYIRICERCGKQIVQEALSVKIFLTGGSGFVGRRLIPRLIAEGHDVVALARSEETAARIRSAGASPSSGDMTAPRSLSAGLECADAVVNLAAHLRMWGDYEEFRAVNVEGVRNLLDAMHASGVRRLVHVSAAAVVMDRPKAMLNVEESAPLRFPRFAPYIRSKAEAEAMIRDVGGGLSVSILRPPFIWGPGSPVARQIAGQIRARQFAWIGGGRYPYAACHVDNLCDAIVASLSRGNGTYFVDDGAAVEFREFISDIVRPLGVDAVGPSVPLPLGWFGAGALEWVWRTLRLRGEPPISRPVLRLIGLPFTLSIERARTDLGYAPKVYAHAE